jgi:hypothetical protein
MALTVWFATIWRRSRRYDDVKKLRKIADALLREAESGNIVAIKEIADRLDGRVAQQITGADEGPIEVSANSPHCTV